MTRFVLLVLAAASFVMQPPTAKAAVLLEFDFTGSTNTSASNTQNSTANLLGVASSTMTRGNGISANNAANSFRGTGFSNPGIVATSDRYFQFSVNAAPTYSLTIESIFGNFNGTSSFSSSPGVTMQWAYSLDNTNYTLGSSTFTRVGTGNSTWTFTGADATALTDIDSVTFRLFASGQTTTGGWGLQSAETPGTIGLAVNGVVAVPEPGSFALLGIAGVALAGLGAWQRRARSAVQAG